MTNIGTRESINKNFMYTNSNQFIEDLKNKLGYVILEISYQGKIQFYTGNFTELLSYENSVLEDLDARKYFSSETYEDLFGEGSFSFKNDSISNYRGLMLNARGNKIFVQISGYCKEEENKESPGVFFLLIQKLSFHKTSQPDTGHIQENIKAHEIVKRYIPPALYKQAKLTVKSGLTNIPDEVRYLTFLFADLVSFTSFAENKTPAEVMETLNLSIGAASSTILHWNGIVDKIMGDSIMAIFENPLNAVISAIEIQKEFRMFNEMRSLQELEHLNIRIGIHSGSCIHGSIGMDKYMEWTVIGDAVNSASRLEKACRVGCVLASEETIKYVKDQINITEKIDISLRGKKNSLVAYYIDSVSFQGMGDEIIKVGIEDSIVF